MSYLDGLLVDGVALAEALADFAPAGAPPAVSSAGAKGSSADFALADHTHQGVKTVTAASSNGLKTTGTLPDVNVEIDATATPVVAGLVSPSVTRGSAGTLAIGSANATTLSLRASTTIEECEGTTQVSARNVDADGANTKTWAQTITSYTESITTRSGTAGLDGASHVVAAQNGQLATGGADNSDGGDVQRIAGSPGTGGSGAAGKYGKHRFDSGLGALVAGPYIQQQDATTSLLAYIGGDLEVYAGGKLYLNGETHVVLEIAGTAILTANEDGVAFGAGTPTIGATPVSIDGESDAAVIDQIVAILVALALATDDRP